MTIRPALAALSLGLLTVACSTPEPAAAPPPAPAGKTVDASTAGALSGRAVFTGAPPAAEAINMAVDRGCVTNAGPNPQSDAFLVAADGGLRNVFVHIKDGLDPAYAFPVPADAVTLDQNGCVYKPRVIGVRAGQPIEFVNSDATMHNVHSLPKVNQEFNFGQLTQGKRDRRTFTAPEVMVRLMCNVHGWMAAWVGVVGHPYYAVTDETGAFELKGVPPGTYTIEAWHEKFGVQTATVTIGERQQQATTFTFAAKGAN
jgi:plastocyanin